jgi:hypothetical protein
MWNHGFEPRFPKLSFISSTFVFGGLDSRVKVEGMPGDVELGVWVGGTVRCNRFLETALADETPGTNLLSIYIFEWGEVSTVSETMSMEILFAICVE